jgi:hypothetical protein
MAEEIQFFEAERRRIADIIDEDGPKILELNRLKVSSADELKSILEEVESAREYRNNELKLEQEKLDRQKVSLASSIFINHTFCVSYIDISHFWKLKGLDWHNYEVK